MKKVKKMKSMKPAAYNRNSTAITPQRTQQLRARINALAKKGKLFP